MELDYKVHNVTMTNLGREASDLSVCATQICMPNEHARKKF